MTTAQPMKFEARDQGEESARAELYGLLATLLHAPASQALLDAIASTPAQGTSELERAWAELVTASKTARADDVRQEYDDLFISVGKPDIMLYGSFYLSGFLMEKPLVELRNDLAALGLERNDQVVESEDHIATLCEVMRYLIASDDAVHGTLDTQRRFFAAHMQPWVLEMCTAIIAHPQARFHSAVAHLAKCFFEVETQAFDMM